MHDGGPARLAETAFAGGVFTETELFEFTHRLGIQRLHKERFQATPSPSVTTLSLTCQSAIPNPASCAPTAYPSPVEPPSYLPNTPQARNKSSVFDETLSTVSDERQIDDVALTAVTTDLASHLLR